MANSSKLLLIAKARGFIDALSGGKDQEKGWPTRAYGEDYNKLVDLVMKDFPALQELLPAKVGTDHGSAMARYVEVRTYCEQIIQMLNALPD